MLYRPYTPRDFDKLYAIEVLCFDQPDRFGSRHMRYLVQRPDAAVWIAELNESIMGFAIVEWTQQIDGVQAYLQTIEVSPEVRCRGVGRELLRRVEGSAVEARAALIWLHVAADNAPAIRLYEAQGYLPRGCQEDYYSRGRAAIVYARRLDLTTAKPEEVAE